MKDDIKSALTFKDYLSVPSGDSFHNFLDVLHDAGIGTTTCEDEFLSSEHAYDDMHTLRDNLGFWGLWMDAKLKGFEALREEGFEAIRETADLSGRVYHNVNGVEIGADWCRRDGVCYVRYSTMVQTEVASREKSKRKRNIEDLVCAERALELMYEHVQENAV